MGWLYQYKTKQEVIEEVTNGSLDYSIYGNEVYALFERNNKKFVVVFLLSKDKDQVGYKDIDQDMHPYYYNCPKKFLKVIDTSHPNALEWKQRCLRLHETRKQKRLAKKVLDNLPMSG